MLESKGYFAALQKTKVTTSCGVVRFLHPSPCEIRSQLVQPVKMSSFSAEADSFRRNFLVRTRKEPDYL
jgi:hypothetical protein